MQCQFITVAAHNLDAALATHRDPDLRNDFEHFDTRLEKWFAESEHRNYVGRNIGPPSAIAGVDTAERFQQFDPDAGVVAFWEHSVSLKDLIVEAARIRQLIPPHFLPR
jgi:hypothetical protein